MISMYTGTPGSYKSYHAVADAVSNLKRGYNVIANFPIDYQRLKINPKGEFVFLKNSDFNVDFFLNYANEHHERNFKTQTVVYIDEAAVIFNARKFSDKDRLNWINFFANHRHFNYNFVLITQMDMMIDKQIRFLVETEIRHRALKNYKSFGAILSLFFKMYLEVEIWYPCKMKVSSRFHIFNKKIADCYDTMALFIEDKSDKKGADKIAKSDDKKSSEVKKVDKSQKQAVLSKIKNRFCTSSDVHDSSDTVDSVDVVDSCNSTSDESSSS